MRKNRGFTLFEVLIALTIVVILMGTLSSVISIAFDNKRKAELAVANVRDMQAVGDFFCQDVSCVVPPNPLSADPNSLAYTNAETAATQASPDAANIEASGGIVGMNVNGTTNSPSYLDGPFKGDSISLSFYATGNLDKSTMPCGVRYVEYRLTQMNDNKLALVRSQDANLLADTAATDLPTEILVRGVTAVSFQYYDGTGWADNWDSSGSGTENMLPYAVKMVLTLEPVDARSPERVITRVATIWCAQQTVDAYNTAVNNANNASTTDTTGGIQLP